MTVCRSATSGLVKVVTARIEEAVVKAGHRPPAGLGLDNGVPKGPTATIWMEPPLGLLNASVSRSRRCQPSPSGGPRPTPERKLIGSDGACPSGIEQRPDVLGGLLILARDGIGVVTRHVDSRPAEASLLLALRNDRVE